jgi:hypothetical protein
MVFELPFVNINREHLFYFGDLDLQTEDKDMTSQKLQNDQRNAKVFNLFVYLLLPYGFRAFF